MKRYDFSGINREVQRRMELGNTHHSLEGERMAEKMLLIPREELEQILGRQLLESTFDWAASNLGDQRIRSIKNGLITLTAEGRAIAERIYSRHKLLTKVLVAIGIDEEKAASEACKIEHDIDDETYEKIGLFYMKYKDQIK